MKYIRFIPAEGFLIRDDDRQKLPAEGGLVLDSPYYRRLAENGNGEIEELSKPAKAPAETKKEKQKARAQSAAGEQGEMLPGADA